MNNPPVHVGYCLEIVMTLIGENTDFKSAKKELANPQKFLDKLLNLDIENISVKTIKKA